MGYKFSKSNKKKIKSTDYSQCEADRLLESIAAQCKKNNAYFKETYKEKEQFDSSISNIKNEENTINLDTGKVYSSNRNLHLAIKKLVEVFGATEREAGIAIENARRNKNIKYPLRHITSSKEVFIENLRQANDAIARYEELKKQGNLFQNI